jgi:hypothetical protein
MTETEYIPGVCNIGKAEITNRKRVANFGLFVYILVSVLVVSNDAPVAARLITFIPALVAAVGFVQARAKFCVAFGFMGVFNLNKIGTTTKVEYADALKADREHALQLLVRAILIASVMTALVVLQ